jgi:formylglycine-generating enzyme required for sulfatase activity
MKTTAVLILLTFALLYASTAHADTFGSGGNTLDIDFVTIGNPGNADDITGKPNPAGKVEYAYRIGKFEISEDMIDKANTEGGLGITKDTRGANKPATDVTWLEATKFVNWLNTSTGSAPAYKLDGGDNFQLWQSGDAGYDPNNLYRNSLATYFLPSMDEWYKAAYYDAGGESYYDYPTGSDFPPTAVASGTEAGTAVYKSITTVPADITLAGGLSPYGTMGQGGNVLEWQETDNDLLNDSPSNGRIYRGGYWNEAYSSNLSSSIHFNNHPSNQDSELGFRVASIPEPSTLLLGAMASIGLMLRRRRSAR